MIKKEVILNQVLQAINEQGKSIIPSKYPRNELKKLRKQAFFCPICKEKVILRVGSKVIPHFAHHPTSTCESARTNESIYHKRAKFQLYQWLQKQQIPVQLEKYIAQIQQQADLLSKYHDRQIAFEFQSSHISSEQFKMRTDGYHRVNITPIWLIGANRLKKVAPYTYRISHSFLPLINDHPHQNQSNLRFYCPNKKRLTILADLHFIRPNLAVALPHHFSLQHVSLNKLFMKSFIPQEKLLRIWLDKKRSFRLSPHSVYGREFTFRKWLYEKRLHVERLPSVIHLPVRLQFKLTVPIWHWQSKLVINVLHPLSIGSKIHISKCLKEIIPYVKEYDEKEAKAIVNQYFTYLTAGKWFRRVNQNEWQKIRQIRFYRYIEEAIEGDQQFINFVIKTSSTKRVLY